VTISGHDASLDPTGWTGLLIVQGALTIRGGFQSRGTVVAQTDLSVLGNGAGLHRGALLAYGRADGMLTTSDHTLIWNCGYARLGGGWIPNGWLTVPGTYKEPPQS
jgi:hypothetical protein